MLKTPPYNLKIFSIKYNHVWEHSIYLILGKMFSGSVVLVGLIPTWYIQAGNFFPNVFSWHRGQWNCMKHGTVTLSFMRALGYEVDWEIIVTLVEDFGINQTEHTTECDLWGTGNSSDICPHCVIRILSKSVF